MKNSMVRRFPKQERGKKRVSIILDAAAELISEVGYEAASTNAIAERAGTSVGSLYQFFPNKETLVQSLAERSIINLHNVLDNMLNDVTINEAPLSLVIDKIIESIIHFSETNPAFTVLLCPLSPQSLKEIAEFLYQDVLFRIKTIFANRSPYLTEDKINLYSTTTVLIFRAMLPALHDKTQRNEPMIAEMKRLLTSYLEPVI